MTKLNTTAQGVFMISVTPFKDDFSLDIGSTDRLLEFYLEKGVTGITILGMMGESAKLTARESLDFARHVLNRVDGRVPVVVGISSPGFAQMREIGISAMDQGAAGVMIAPAPSLRTDEQLLGYFRDVSGVLGDDVPIVLQDFPSGTGVVMSAPLILDIVREVPSCVMLKHEDWPGLGKISAIRSAETAGRSRRISILAGNGGLFLPEELRRGADGAMTGFGFPEMLVSLCTLHAKRELERASDLFDAYLPLLRYEQQPGLGLLVRKQVLALRGAIASPVARKPAPTLSPQDRADIERLLDRQTRRLEELGETLCHLRPSL